MGTTATGAGVTNGTGVKTSSQANAPWIELFTTRLTNTTSFVEPEVANQESANPVNAEDGSPKVVTMLLKLNKSTLAVIYRFSIMLN